MLRLGGKGLPNSETSVRKADEHLLSNIPMFRLRNSKCNSAMCRLRSSFTSCLNPRLLPALSQSRYPSSNRSTILVAH